MTAQHLFSPAELRELLRPLVTDLVAAGMSADAVKRVTGEVLRAAEAVASDPKRPQVRPAGDTTGKRPGVR